MVEMEVNGVYTKSGSPYPQVMLKEKDGSGGLKIVIGQFEALAIFMAYNQKKPTRPISYDLARSILEAVDARVVKVEITELHDNTYFAGVHLRDDTGKVTVLDSRPSDAIAVALRMHAPIFAAAKILEESDEVESDEEIQSAEEVAHPETSVLKAVLKAGAGDAESAATKRVVAEEEETAASPLESVAQLDQLKRMLERAVAEEAYEEAARLRDEINRLATQ